MFKKILVPLDGSDLATKILPQVEDLAKSMRAEVTLITVGDSLTSGLASEFAPMHFDEFYAGMKAQAEGNLAETEEALKARDVKVSSIYRGNAAPAQEIIAYAANNSFDLIAMATHGKGELAWMIGSVAEKVVTHATVPVLLLRVLDSKSPVTKAEHFSESTN
jgi:nucleotide-binding universal stress UspA family protein